MFSRGESCKSKLSAFLFALSSVNRSRPMSDAEIAAMLGHSRGKSAMTLNRTRAKLQRSLSRKKEKET